MDGVSKIKTAIVTGAGRNQGIGAEICRMLSRKGIDVFFTSCEGYDSDFLNVLGSDYTKTLAECRSFGSKVFFETFDLTSQSNIAYLFNKAEIALGHIEILVNCICCHQFDDIDDITPELLDINFQVNAKSIFLLCREFYRRFTGTSGRIVNLSSTQNLEPLTTEISYALSKATIPVLVSTLAPIMATKGITINAVNPGATEIGDKTDKNMDQYQKSNLFDRPGSPTDAANIVSFLVSKEGEWITGQTLNSEGGVFRTISGGIHAGL
jgi:3-oxoacyl-[acyl-carrier protein] reductase